MKLVWNRRLNFLLNLVLSFLLIGSMDLSFAQQMVTGEPFPSDSGTLTMPPESTEELQESMPELQLFPPQDPSQIQPFPGDALGSPDF